MSPDMNDFEDPFEGNRAFLNRLMRIGDAMDRSKRMNNKELASKIQGIAAQLPDESAPYLMEAAERLYPIELTDNELGKN